MGPPKHHVDYVKDSSRVTKDIEGMRDNPVHPSTCRHRVRAERLSTAAQELTSGSILLKKGGIAGALFP